MKPEQMENKQYEEKASDFGTISMEENLMLEMLRRYASEKKQPLKVLDIGCGSGTIAKEWKTTDTQSRASISQKKP